MVRVYTYNGTAAPQTCCWDEVHSGNAILTTSNSTGRKHTETQVSPFQNLLILAT
jgi:hypothetical protein